MTTRQPRILLTFKDIGVRNLTTKMGNNIKKIKIHRISYFKICLFPLVTILNFADVISFSNGVQYCVEIKSIVSIKCYIYSFKHAIRLHTLYWKHAQFGWDVKLGDIVN